MSHLLIERRLYQYAAKFQNVLTPKFDPKEILCHLIRLNTNVHGTLPNTSRNIN